MKALTRALNDSRAYSRLAMDAAARHKATGGLGEVLSWPEMGGGGVSGWRQDAVSRESYSLNRGWLYSANHILSLRASSQPLLVGRMSVGSGGKSAFTGDKSYWFKRMPAGCRAKAAVRELEILVDHPLVDALERPNPFQSRNQMVYSFVANLNLTGIAYLVGGRKEDGGTELYSLPTTWVKPNKDRTKYEVIDPTAPSRQGTTFDADHVACAFLPNPRDPRQPLSPVQSQIAAIRVDEYIQSSQERFFQQGVLPSVVVTVGKRPYPGRAEMGRPIMTPEQRLQVYTAINSYMARAANFYRPVILDGMMESVSRFSQTAQEMDWSKSEDKVRTRILSCLGVHPYMMGETMPGSMSQAYIIEKLFCERVNVFIDMFSTAATSLLGDDESLMIWLEECQPRNQEAYDVQLRFARKNGDISQNEMRAELGYPPDEDHNQANLSPGLANSVVTMLRDLGMGYINADQAFGVLTQMGLSDEAARQISSQAGGPATLGRAVDSLREAVAVLKESPRGLQAMPELSSLE